MGQKLRRYNQLKEKVSRLQAEISRTESELSELCNDIDVKREIDEQEKRHEAYVFKFSIYGLTYASEEASHAIQKAGIKTIADLINTLDTCVCPFPELDKRKTNKLRKDMKNFVRYEKAERYEREVLEGKLPILIGMRAYFPSHILPHRELPYGSNHFGFVTSVDHDAIKVHLVHPDEDVTVPRKTIAKIVLGRHFLDELIPLDNCDIHELIQMEVEDNSS